MVTDALGVNADSARISASTSVYADLRRRILALDLPPDTTLDRSEIAARYGISQSPVREAIQRLEQEGLVASFPQSRTVVTRIDRSRISEEHFLRQAVECEAVRRLAEKPVDAVIVRLGGYLRLQEALVDDFEQIALFRELDEAFHEAILEGVGQQGLSRRIAANSGHLARVRTLDMPRAEKLRAVYEGHKSVVEALRASDPVAAMAAMRQHLSGTIERIPAIREKHPDYFR